LVLVTALSAAALGVGAAVSVQHVISERRGPAPTVPAPTIPSRTTEPTMVPDASAPLTDDLGSPTPSPQADAHPTPTPDATSEPAAQDDRSGKTQKPDSGSGTTAHPTPRPTKTPKPKKTPRPQPTKTPRPGRTPHPTEHPERTDRPEPTETPEPKDGGGHGGEGGASETDTPEDGSVRSGGVRVASLVPPFWWTRPEGPA
jgi:hypothetical protein